MSNIDKILPGLGDVFAKNTTIDQVDRSLAILVETLKRNSNSTKTESIIEALELDAADRRKALKNGA